MIVAYHIMHSEGLMQGMLTGSNQTVNIEELYEADGYITTHATVEDAKAWLDEQDRINREDDEE